ncbi:U3-containing 90S pre-ribosomal complex subunit-domain containing protein [Powellomyces hirtus]|nr:U3-containing 90S pre-ribosomal complex subunit-domain containing protein [Powellomyces hirtus]
MAGTEPLAQTSADSLEGDAYLDDFVPADLDDGDILVPADIEDDGELPQEPPTARKRKAEDITTAPQQEKKPKEKRKKPKKDYSIDQKALLAEQGIPLKDCSHFEHSDDAHFADFIRDDLFGKRALKLFGKEYKHPAGSPKVIVLSGSAIRAANVARLVRNVGNCKVAKLFGKHLKASEQARVLGAEPFPVAVGTANRIKKLIEDGSLKLDELEFVVADATYRDQKNRTLFDVPENKADLLDLLKKTSETAKICLY